VYQAAKSIDALGVPVLRFNFRGAGLSAGLHDHGQGEQGDVEAAIEFLASEWPKAGLLVAGFSFGSWVGLRVGCADARVIELLAMGLPVNNSDFSYLSHCVKSKLIVQGTSDEHGAWEEVEQVLATTPGSNRVEFLAGADHFFSGRLDELDRAITEWLVEQHPELRPSRGELPDGHPLR
jgi:alpha/beta superfamily hydrolase